MASGTAGTSSTPSSPTPPEKKNGTTLSRFRGLGFSANKNRKNKKVKRLSPSNCPAINSRTLLKGRTSPT